MPVWKLLALYTAFSCNLQVEQENLRFLQPLSNLKYLRSHQTYRPCFHFINQGSMPLEILTVEPSCGCLTHLLDQRSYAPGEEGCLVLEVKPASQPGGPHSWFAKVRYRCGEKVHETNVQIQAVIWHEISVYPTYVALHGSGGLKQEIVITDTRPTPLKVTKVHFSSALGKVQVISATGSVTRILLETSPLPAQRLEEVLSIFTDDLEYDHFRVPVRLVGVAKVKISATPERITLQVPAGKSPPSTLVRLRPTDDKTLKVAKVNADDPAILCTWAAGPDNGATLKIAFDPAKVMDRNLESRVRVWFLDSEEILIIPVQVSR